MKSFRFKRSPLFYAGLLVVMGLSAVLGHFVQQPYTGECRIYDIKIILESEDEAKIEIYYNIGRGFHEIDHQEAKVEIVDEKVELNFSVPVWKEFSSLRIDPVGASVKMKIFAIEITSADTRFYHSVSLADIEPVHQIVKGHWDGRSYNFETSADASDPMLLVENIKDPQGQPGGKSLAVYALWIGGGIAATFLVNWIFRFFILGL